MEKRITQIEEPIIKAIQVGTQMVDKIEYVACDGTVHKTEKDCIWHEEYLEREKLIEDIPFRKVDTEYIDVPSRYYYCHTTDKYNRLIKYLQFDEKVYWLDEHKILDETGKLIKPLWIGVEYHDGCDSRDYYTITTFDEIQRDYQKLSDAFQLSLAELVDDTFIEGE
jgi:hypothetical protein